eukprot:g25689.t1
MDGLTLPAILMGHELFKIEMWQFVAQQAPTREQISRQHSVELEEHSRPGSIRGAGKLTFRVGTLLQKMGEEEEGSEINSGRRSGAGEGRWDGV